MSDDMKRIMNLLVDAKLQEIHLNQEKFLQAFIAETGLKPSEAVMVTETDGPKACIWFREKNYFEKQLDKLKEEDSRLLQKLGALNEILEIISKYGLRHDQT